MQPQTDDDKEMRALIQRAEKGDAGALADLRTRLELRPQVWESFGDLAMHARQAWLTLHTGSNPVVKEGAERKIEAMRRELLGSDPSPLERLLAERIIVCWCQLAYADHRAAAFEEKGGSFRQGEYWQRQQERAHRRYLSAIRSLAQVRRLLTPTVQVNIADQQVNLVS